MADIHQNDIGTELVVAVVDESNAAVDISAASALQIFLLPPSGAANLKTKTAVLDSTGADGLMKYVTADGDLDEVGPWQIEGKVTLGASTWRTAVSQFLVASNLA